MATDPSSVAPDRHPPPASGRRHRARPPYAALRSAGGGSQRATRPRKPGSRGHMVFACGTGRTLIALRTAEALDTRLLLVWCRPGI